MQITTIALAVITALVATHASREAIHVLRRLARRMYDNFVEQKFRDLAHTVLVALATLAYGFYYWLATYLIVLGGAPAH